MLRPPVEPMLATLARQLPEGTGWRFEPKWDGFRCLVFRDGDDVDLRSRNQRPLARYFPEVVAACRSLPADDYVADGELVIRGHGAAGFDRLLKRIHPAATHVARMVEEAPATLILFDLLAADERDLRDEPFSNRRARLDALVDERSQTVVLSPITDDRDVASEWLDLTDPASGIDGVVAKQPDQPYAPGKRVLVKVKPVRTADCVVAGFRLLDARPVISSLLLGCYDDARNLRHVGVVGSLTEARRREILDVVRPCITPLEGHPWEHGFALEGGSMGRLPGSAGRWTPQMTLDWVPLRPELVCEVAYDHADGLRFRHPAKFLRWRPDRGPRSCTTDQLEPARATSFRSPPLRRG